jgi:hypothetical protein
MTTYNSGKNTKFVTLAEKRVNNALKAIKIIGNLSNRNNYEYTDKDVKKIVAALRQEVQTVEQKFSAGGSGPASGFKL